jgi:hypothetical protein
LSLAVEPVDSLVCPVLNLGPLDFSRRSCTIRVNLVAKPKGFRDEVERVGSNRCRLDGNGRRRLGCLQMLPGHTKEAVLLIQEAFRFTFSKKSTFAEEFPTIEEAKLEVEETNFGNPVCSRDILSQQ